MPNDDEDQGPAIRIVRGQPDEAELAAVVSVLTRVQARPPQQHGPTVRSGWADPTYMFRWPPHSWPKRGRTEHGMHGWRTSSLPR